MIRLLRSGTGCLPAKVPHKNELVSVALLSSPSSFVAPPPSNTTVSVPKTKSLNIPLPLVAVSTPPPAVSPSATVQPNIPDRSRPRVHVSSRKDVSPSKVKKTATMDGTAAAKQQSAGARGTGAKKQRAK